MIHARGAATGRLRSRYRPSDLVAVTALIYLVDGWGLTYGAVFHRGGTNAASVLGLLAALAYGLAAYPLVRGRRFGVPEATGMLSVQVVAIGLMSHNTHLDLAALGDGLALPVLGAYASWLLSRSAAAVFYAGLVLWIGAILERGNGYLTAVALMLAAQAVITTEIVRAMRRNVRRLTDTDPLTGLLNRRALERTADELLERCHRDGGTFTVALIDVDDLRKVNNSAGHLAGDALLVAAAREWRATFSPNSVTVGRIGGDEFLLLFDGVDETDARRLLAALQTTSSVPWTAGVAQAGREESLTQVLGRADADMYGHKGRKRPAAAWTPATQVS